METRVPVYRRARGYRIYGERGNRFLDFFQDGGRAILGHRNPSIMLEAKNLLSRGQITAYPSSLIEKTRQAVMALIPGLETVRIYASGERALEAASLHLGEPVSRATAHDPATAGASAGTRPGVSLWRPFLESESFDFPLLIPVLPVSAPPAPAVLAFREKPAPAVRESDICSPVSLGMLKKAVFELIRYAEGCDRSRWEAFDTISDWSRKGPYLTLKRDEREFPGIFNQMLERGILLSPEYPGPSIIPGEYSPGEFASFKSFFAV